MVTIVDYGLGNLGSIRNMLKKVGCPSTISGDPRVIAAATKLILPGVGAFDHGMANLAKHGLLAALNESVHARRTPVLGICLGMQLLAERSEEGSKPGLGWIPGEVIRFRQDSQGTDRLKIPHIGWNFVRSAVDHPLLSGLQNPRFYFVHSYHLCCRDQRDAIGWTH
ncbi:MAG: imidazole glycerol phosphate synthase subunit HisH, partial [Pirellulaceae bacterium]